MKFVSLLQDAKDGVLDLKVVSETAVAGSVLVCVGCFQGEWTGATFQRQFVNKGVSVTYGAGQVH